MLRSWLQPRGAASPRYSPLPTPKSPKQRFGPLTTNVLAALLVTLSLSVAFLAGQRYPGEYGVVKFEKYPHTFRYDEVFAAKPNLSNDKAWLDLFPLQGGFFQHPKIARERSTFAVWHQLHCLDGLRHAYWTLHGMALEGKTIEPEAHMHGDHGGLPHHASPAHVMHCIDLIRNALMCQPDLTLEVVNASLDGVTGFGTQHQCVRWKELLDWTSAWEGYGQEGQ